MKIYQLDPCWRRHPDDDGDFYDYVTYDWYPTMEALLAALRGVPAWIMASCTHHRWISPDVDIELTGKVELTVTITGYVEVVTSREPKHTIVYRTMGHNWYRTVPETCTTNTERAKMTRALVAAAATLSEETP